MPGDIKNHRRDMIRICRLMHQKGFVSGADSNVSIRLSKDRFLLTPSGISKAFVEEKDLLIINKNAKIIKGRKGLKPSSECMMHLKAFELRPDISAVIHAHPPYTIAFSVAGIRMPGCVLPETVILMGDIPVTGYSTPASAGNSDVIEKYIKDYDALILQRHGTLTVGADIFSAYNRLENVESTALIGFAATAMGGIKSLGREEVKRLHKIGKDLGLLNRQDVCVNCDYCGPKTEG